MYTYDVTIGRNVAGVPMTELAWNKFRGDVASGLVQIARMHADTDNPEVWTVESWSHGLGMWLGQNEESVHYQLRTRDKVEPYMLGNLRTYMAQLARAHRQEAIVLQVGTSELITPARDHELAEFGSQVRNLLTRAEFN